MTSKKAKQDDRRNKWRRNEWNSNFPDWWTYILNGCTIIRSHFDIGFAVRLIRESLQAYLIYDPRF